MGTLSQKQLELFYITILYLKHLYNKNNCMIIRSAAFL
jgi:hypothetical protein